MLSSEEDSGLRKALQIAESLKKPVSVKQALSAFAEVKGQPLRCGRRDCLQNEKGRPRPRRNSRGETATIFRWRARCLSETAGGRPLSVLRAALGKKLEAARILKVGKPIMEKLAKPKKLSQISEIVDLMLGYTQVELGITAMDEWDEYDSWVEKQLTRIPLFTDILDPTFLIIRGPLLGCPCACRNTCISQQSSCWWKSAGRWPFRKSNSPRASQRCRSSCPRHVPVCRSSRCRNCTRSSHWLGIWSWSRKFRFSTVHGWNEWICLVVRALKQFISVIQTLHPEFQDQI